MARKDKMAGLLQGLPIVQWLGAYDRRWLREDLLAGASVSAVLIPSAMAHATLAGLPATAGLYASMMAMIVYAVFGTSRRLHVGTEAAMGLLTATVLAPLLVSAAPEQAWTLACLLTLLAGAVCLVAGWLHLGFITRFLSVPILSGYMIGVGLTIIGSQLASLIGLGNAPSNFFLQLVHFAGNLAELHPLTTAIGLATLLLLGIAQWLTPRLPASLLLMVASILLSWLWSWEEAGVTVVGQVPGGLPTLQWPAVAAVDLPDLLWGGLTIGLLVFISSFLTAKVVKGDDEEPLDANRELVAYGLMNVAAGLFRGLPVSGSNSRSIVSVTSGARTQLSNLVAVVVLVLVLTLLTAWVRPLPQAVLAAILIVAAIRMIQPSKVYDLFRTRVTEGGLTIATVLGVLVLGVVRGIAVAVILSLVDVIVRQLQPHDAALAELEHPERFHQIEKGATHAVEPGLIVYRFDALLFFANVPHFMNRARELLKESRTKPRWFVLNAEAIPSMDATALEELETLHEELQDEDIRLVIARANENVRKMLRRSDLWSDLQGDVYESVEAAVAAFRRTGGGGPKAA